MLLEEEVSLEEPRHANAGFVRYKLGRWDGEDLIDFFQSQLFGLPNEEEDQGPCNQVKTRIETESTGRSHNSSHTRESYTEDTGKEVVNEYGPSHTLFSLNSREDFCRVLESDGSFTEGITNGEKVDEEYDRANLRRSASGGIEERETSGEKEDTHKGEGN